MKAQRGMKSSMVKGEVSSEAQAQQFHHPLYYFPAIFLYLAKHQFHFPFLPLKLLLPFHMSLSLPRRFAFSRTPSFNIQIRVNLIEFKKTTILLC